MRILLLALGFCLVIAAPRVEAQMSANYYSLEEIKQKLLQRMFTANYFYGGLTDVLPYYSMYSINAKFTVKLNNGLPNAVNVIAWALTLKEELQAHSISCPGSYSVRPEFSDALYKICQWPKDEARSDAVMLEFWQTVMSFDAPYTEYAAWRDFFLSEEYKNKSNVQTVSDMLVAMLLNPHFLLQK